jgi:acyl-CoA synthetase (AMP-forming)/AMP-acid ligase II
MSMACLEELKAREFGTLSELLRCHAAERPEHPAVIEGERSLNYAAFDRLVDRVAAALQRDGFGKGGVAAICAAASIEYAAAFLGILRAGGAVAPLSPSSTAAALAAMIDDCGASHLFLDRETDEALGGTAAVKRIAVERLGEWLAPKEAVPADVGIAPGDPFNIIYSSGTTGTPKGIVQPHALRWTQFFRLEIFSRDAVTLVATPLYSNTTLVAFLPTLASGGTVVLMPKFEAGAFLALSERHRVTHTMLVPVQYRRIMERPDFGSFDLASYVVKFATSAPFAAALKADVLARWPGGLVEFYGMTEGGGSCVLIAHEHPDKLATVGVPAPGHDIRLIGEDGREVAQGELGEVVGRSGAMMIGYHKQAEKTRQAEWYSPEGLRYIRTGDVGRFDADGFLTLMDRKKDMIISGGFNIYPSDIEAELATHPEVIEAAVLGVPSDRWGETPVAYVVPREGAGVSPDALKAWVNDRLGKTQRLADLRFIDSLPRSAIGKVLKRELRETYAAG